MDKDYEMLKTEPRWWRLRRETLGLHRYCERCGRNLSSVVRHKIPVSSGYNYNDKKRLMYDRGNLEAVCRECMDRIMSGHGR